MIRRSAGKRSFRRKLRFLQCGRVTVIGRYKAIPAMAGAMRVDRVAGVVRRHMCGFSGAVPGMGIDFSSGKAQSAGRQQDHPRDEKRRQNLPEPLQHGRNIELSAHRVKIPPTGTFGDFFETVGRPYSAAAARCA